MSSVHEIGVLEIKYQRLQNKFEETLFSVSKQVLFYVEFTTEFEGKSSLKGRSLSNFIQASFMQKERTTHGWNDSKIF